MTFEDFQQLCSQAATSGQNIPVACPIVVGDGEIIGSLGDTHFHDVVIFKTQPDNAVLQSIYRTVRFSFDAPNNQTVIQPLTHETS